MIWSKKSQQAAQLYEAYVAKATAAGEALQKVLTESSASASASDLVQAAKKIQTDWADYEHKRDAAAAALAHFKSASADAPHAGLYTNLPVVLMAEDWQPVQADVNQDLSAGVFLAEGGFMTPEDEKDADNSSASNT